MSAALQDRGTEAKHTCSLKTWAHIPVRLPRRRHRTGELDHGVQQTVGESDTIEQRRACYDLVYLRAGFKNADASVCAMQTDRSADSPNVAGCVPFWARLLARDPGKR